MTDVPPPPHGDQPPTGSSGTPGPTSGPGYPPPYGSGYQPQPLRPEDERLWSTLIHVGGIFFGFVPALIGYLVLRDRGPFVREQSRAALNFQIMVAIAGVASAVLTAVIIGFVLGPVVVVLNIIFSIMAAVAANRGQYYRYPLTIEFIKS